MGNGKWTTGNHSREPARHAAKETFLLLVYRSPPAEPASQRRQASAGRAAGKSQDERLSQPYSFPYFRVVKHVTGIQDLHVQELPGHLADPLVGQPAFLSIGDEVHQERYISSKPSLR